MGSVPPPFLPPSLSMCNWSMFAKSWPRSDDRGHELPWCLPLAVSHSSLQSLSRLRSCRALPLSRPLSLCLSVCLARTHTLACARCLSLSCPLCRASRSIPPSLTGGFPQSRLPAAQLTARACHGQQTASAQWAGGKSGTVALEP